MCDYLPKPHLTKECAKPCPFCGKAPLLASRGSFIRGGCAAHLPEAVLQPSSMPAEAVRQWNRIVESIVLP